MSPWLPLGTTLDQCDLGLLCLQQCFIAHLKALHSFTVGDSVGSRGDERLGNLLYVVTFAEMQ